MAGRTPLVASDELVSRNVVRAAGGVVWRRADNGVEVLLVHRPKYDDWSLPKGKLHGGEREREAAVREVLEETGLRCEVGRELGTTRYTDRYGRPKTVRYWAMRAIDGAFEPGDEVDAVHWLSPDAARAQVSYAHDARMITRFEATGS